MSGASDLLLTVCNKHFIIFYNKGLAMKIGRIKT